ncbi:MAG TPA: hypothetical protein VGB04_05500 [Allosphingosinicella sp.]|jgi:hypothetical protein
MKRLMLAVGGLLLATANTPPPSGSAAHEPEGELSSVVAAEAPAEAAKPAKPLKPAKPHRMAAAPADPSPAGYPRCSSSVRDRCVQGRSAVAHRSAARHRGMQLAMRAGERG